ncbi:MAG TPA: hypothetical protein VKX49_27305 [Bryobacteraceae bacterium]|nr:hypothetical protein [Bryobacteraceae bacterium]
MKRVLFVFALALAAWAQPSLAPPQIGFAEDGASLFRPVLGVAGNFILGDAVFSGVAYAAYSGSYGLLKTGTSVITTDNKGQLLAAMDAPPGPASFAFFRDGSPAFAYLPGPNLLFAWYGSGFEMTRFDCQLFPPNAVVGISAPDAAHVVFLIQGDGGLREVSVLIETGQAESQIAIAGVAAPALRLASGVLVYGGANGIVIRAADSSEVHLAGQFPTRFSLALMGAEWVELSHLASSARFAIRITPGHEGFFLLPEASHLPDTRHLPEMSRSPEVNHLPEVNQ